MRMTRHDYSALTAMTSEKDLPYARIPRNVRAKLEDLGYADHDGSGFYNITAAGRKALAEVRGAPIGTPFAHGDIFQINGDMASIAWVKRAHVAGLIKITPIKQGKWRITAC